MSPASKTTASADTASADTASKARLAMMAKAKAAILKHTKQKPLGPSESTRPHVPTGSFAMDVLIGGTPTKDGKGMICPGFPRRGIVELYGPESSGKTTIATQGMIEVQRGGGCAMMLDFEHAFNHSYAKAQGLSYAEDKMMIYQPTTLEEGFKMMYIGIMSGIDLIVVDSVAAMVPKEEMEKGFDAEARVGGVARPLSRALPKFANWLHKYPQSEKGKMDPDHPGTCIIFINQTRDKIGGMSRDTETTSGGKALKFYANLRLRVSRIRSEYVEKKDPITGKKTRRPYGNVTNVKVVKSKLDAKQGHSCEIFIRYGLGVDDHLGIIESGVTQKLLSKEGSYYAIGDHRFQGKEKFRQFLIENPQVYNALKAKLADAIIGSAIDGPVELDDEDDLLEGVDLEFGDIPDDGDTEEVFSEAAAG